MKKLKKFMAVACSFALMFVTLTVFSPSQKAADTGSPTMSIRIEGLTSNIYSNSSYSFTSGDNFYDILTAALSTNKPQAIPIVFSPDITYGHMITSINGETSSYPVWWHIYVNGKSSDVGIDELIPKSGDSVVLYLGDDSKVLFPTITLSPEHPVEGETAAINVSASYTDYSDWSNPIQKTVEISNAVISFNGKAYTTDTSGNVEITMPSAGDYTYSVTKETPDSTQAIVRTGNVPLTVYTKATAPSNTDSGSNPDTASSVSSTATISEINSAINSAADYLTAKGITDWNGALALLSAEKTIPESYFDSVEEELESYGSSITPTRLAGIIIGLKAAGADPRSFNSTDLVAELCGSKNIGKTGLNGYIYTLLALDSGNFEIPSGSSFTRDSLLQNILSCQNVGGSFSLDKTSLPDCDITAAAITALAPYTGKASVKTAVDNAVTYLSKVQKSDGGFLNAYSSSEASESASQVIIALSSVGINPLTDSRFIKNSNSPLSNLLSYKNTDGGFSHIKGSQSDTIATSQALEALSAYKLMQSGKNLFNLINIPSSPVSTMISNPETGDTKVPFVLLSAAVIGALVLIKKEKISSSGTF